MQTKDFYALFYIITLFLLIFYSLFLITLKQKRTVRHLLLACFLTALAFSYLHNVANTFIQFFFTYFPWAIYFGISFELLTGPSLFLYMKSITVPGFHLKKTDLFHLLPFVLHFSYFSYHYTFLPAETQRKLLMSYAVFTSNEILASLISNHVHFLVYTTLTIGVIRKYRIRLKQSQSSLKGINLKWAIFIASGLMINWSYHFVNSYLWLKMDYLDWIKHVDARPFLVGSAFIFACVIVYKSLQDPKILYDFETGIVPKLKFTDLEQRELNNKITLYMKNKKPYINPNFDLRSLAQDIDISPQRISHFLNHYLDQSFYDFVNDYRIQESQRLLVSQRDSYKNITEIMYETGFNSKSVFFTVFKKTTGMTPMQFRKSMSKPETVEN